MSNSQWHIAHKPSRSQSGPCSEDELVLFCIQQKSLDEIVVWKKGMVNWMLLTSTPELQSVIDRYKAMLPEVGSSAIKPSSKNEEYLFDILAPAEKEPLPAKPSEATPIKLAPPPEQSVHVVEFAEPEEGDGRNRRKHTRVDLRLKAILSNSEQTFMTFTRDISESGLCLEVEAPTHFFKENLDLILQDEKSKKRIKFKVNAVLDKNNPRRFFFTGLSDQKKAELLLWIQSTMQSQQAS